MNVLWITYAPLGATARVLCNSNAQSGTWIDALMNSMLTENENLTEKIHLGIASIFSNDEKKTDDTGVTFYGVGGIKKIMGKECPKDDIKIWKKVINDFKPDIIQVWGTEYSNGCSIVKAAEDIPVVFFIQGVVGRIANYNFGEIRFKELKKYLNLFSLIKLIHFNKQNNALINQAKYEKEMVNQSAGYIVDNQWSGDYFKLYSPNASRYIVPLPINDLFKNNNRSDENVKSHRIFTIAGNNPAKGIHDLIKATAIVKAKYPDIKIVIPGSFSFRKPEFIFETPYFTYIKKLIKELSLEDNVEFKGSLTSEQMALELKSSDIFVMPSCIENHSASLREAMHSGVPCITTLVGGISEYAKHGENCLTYRYGEADALACDIISLFDNSELKEKLGRSAKEMIKNIYDDDNNGKYIIDIYNRILSEK